MNPKDKLIDAFQSDARIQRFKALEKEIEKHPSLLQAYEAIKLAQQQYVRANAQKKPDAPEKKHIYETKLKGLKENPFIDEYLDLIEELNYDLQWTIGEIESAINAALHPAFKDPE